MNQTEITKDLSSEFKASFEVDQKGSKQTLLVRKDRIVIGSIESADIKLKGSRIAPIHAFVEIVFGATEGQSQARIVDLASPTGVMVNGKKAINEPIKAGDLIQVGEAIIRFGFQKPLKGERLSDRSLLLIDEKDVVPIFDYRPGAKEALEVVCSWSSIILNVKHFVRESEVRLGERKDDDFLIPPVLTSTDSLRFIQKTGAQWTLFFDKKMKGVLYLNGELHSVEGLGRPSVALGVNDFAKIEIGTLSFYVSQTVAPPELKKQRAIITDPFLGKTLMTSLAVTFLILFGVSRMDITPTEAPPPTEPIATILYHPEKYSVKRPEPPKPVEKKPEEKIPEVKPQKNATVDFTKPKQDKKAQVKSSQPGKHQAAQSQAKGGAGAKAKGAAGSRGEKNAQASAKPQTAAKRPSPTVGKNAGGTISQSADNGNVQMLKGETSKILDILGGSGQKLGKSGSKLAGFAGFSTQGNGGLALSGKGKGGGGNADTLLGGESNHGRGGGKVGTGLGSEGTGAGIVGGKTRVELNVGGGDETVVVGSIDRDAIEAAIRAHRDEFRYCYEKELNTGHPTLAGKVVTAFVIGGSGRASQLAVASSSLGSPSVERCVLSILGRIQFPQPAGGVPVTIKYPFAYNGGSK